MYAVRLVAHWLWHIEQTFANKVMLDAVNGATGCKQLTQAVTAVEPAEAKIGQAHSVELHPNAASIEPH